MYGISEYNKMKSKVEKALEKACQIRNEVVQVAAIEERAFL